MFISILNIAHIQNAKLSLRLIQRMQFQINKGILKRFIRLKIIANQYTVSLMLLYSFANKEIYGTCVNNLKKDFIVYPFVDHKSL